MSPASRTRFWWALAYLLIVVLVFGGLGWVTAAALRVERSDQLRLALWRLDSRVSPALAREDSRPFQHFDPLYIPLPALQRNGTTCATGTVLVASPLLSASLPDWMLVHFQATAGSAWRSPQVPSNGLAERLRLPGLQVDLSNVTHGRAQSLELLKHYSAGELIARLPEMDSPTQSLPAPGALAQQPQAESQNGQTAQMWTPNRDNDFQQRDRVQRMAKAESTGNLANNAANYKVAPVSEEFVLGEVDAKWAAMNPVALTSVKLGEFQPLWLHAEGQSDRLVIARLAQPGQQKIVQGVLLDWDNLRGLLLDEVRDLFPHASLEPVNGDAGELRERMMTTLPVQLDPGSMMSLWSPLRTGLLLAWLAALGALTVVGFGGRSLLELSDRRIRFVSAVTHELRTPLTTLRLYLDMLTSGLVTDERKKSEYLHTLHGESDRLHRLVGNVLDFARLERQRPKLALRDVTPGGILDRAGSDWVERCKAAGKELIVECPCPAGTIVHTDPDLVQQILGNLIDNACKYSRGSSDERIWLRAGTDKSSLVFEVEDRGPGVPARERREIFQAFRRGQSADVTAGGVGLGLALARRWANLLGGTLSFEPGPDGVGARFRLQI